MFTSRTETACITAINDYVSNLGAPDAATKQKTAEKAAAILFNAQAPSIDGPHSLKTAVDTLFILHERVTKNTSNPAQAADITQIALINAVLSKFDPSKSPSLHENAYTLLTPFTKRARIFGGDIPGWNEAILRSRLTSSGVSSSPTQIEVKPVEPPPPVPIPVPVAPSGGAGSAAVAAPTAPVATPEKPRVATSEPAPTTSPGVLRDIQTAGSDFQLQAYMIINNYHTWLTSELRDNLTTLHSLHAVFKEKLDKGPDQSAPGRASLIVHGFKNFKVFFDAISRKHQEAQTSPDLTSTEHAKKVVALQRLTALGGVLTHLKSL